MIMSEQGVLIMSGLQQKHEAILTERQRYLYELSRRPDGQSKAQFLREAVKDRLNF